MGFRNGTLLDLYFRMEQLQPKFSNVILSIMLFAFGVAALKVISKFLFVDKVEVKQGYSYEMGRVQTYGGQFDLSDREIEHLILSEDEKKKVAVDTKNEKGEKKDEKKQSKKSAKNANTANNQNSRGALISTRIIGQNKNAELSPSEDLFKRSATNYNSEFVNNTSEQPNEDDAEGGSGKENIKSAQQWKDQISANPSMTNVQGFLQAHRKGQIRDEDFYQVAFDLFLDPNKNRENAGYLLLSIDSALSGFSFMAKKYGTISEAKRTLLWKILSSYSRFDHFSALNHSLANQDQIVVGMALQVLQIAVNEAKNSSSNNSSTVMTPVASLAMFIPNLTRVAQIGSSSQTGQLANALLTDIQNLLKK